MKISYTTRSSALTVLVLLLRFAASAKPTSFCKCTCFTNSTIIPLDAHIIIPDVKSALLLPRVSDSQDDVQEPVPDPPPIADKDPEDDAGKAPDDHDQKEYRAGNCNDCTRQFCLDYNLPICKKAALEDVFTTCFQRDSRKDEAVVFIFIFATVGLLLWAAIKPWVSKWIDTARERSSYIPVSSGGDT